MSSRWSGSGESWRPWSGGAGESSNWSRELWRFPNIFLYFWEDFELKFNIIIADNGKSLLPAILVRLTSVGHHGEFGHEFLEFEITEDGRLRYGNNSNYRNDILIRKEGESRPHPAWPSCPFGG